MSYARLIIATLIVTSSLTGPLTAQSSKPKAKETRSTEQREKREKTDKKATNRKRRDGASAPRRPRTMTCTSSLVIRPGRPGPNGHAAQHISLRYRAALISELTIAAMGRNPRARAFVNARVLRRIIRFSTDVPVGFGAKILPAGTYDAGFQCLSGDRWRFVIVDRRNEPAVDIELKSHTVETPITRLNMSLIPADKGDAFFIAFRYGKRRSMVRARYQPTP